MVREFKEFVLKGNLLELAVAFVLGLAFAQVVSALNFLLIALVLFFVIRAYNRLRPPAAATMKPCPFCFTDVPLAATRCPACTSQLESTAA